MLKKNVSILDIAKKLRDFNPLSIAESVFSVGSMDSRRGNLVFIREILSSIKIVKIPTTVKPELIRRSVTRDSSRLSSLNPK